MCWASSADKEGFVAFQNILRSTKKKEVRQQIKPEKKSLSIRNNILI